MEDYLSKGLCLGVEMGTCDLLEKLDKLLGSSCNQRISIPSERKSSTPNCTMLWRFEQAADMIMATELVCDF